MKKILLLTLLLISFYSSSYASIKISGDYSAYSSTNNGDFPIEYITFYNYGEKKDSTRFQIDIFTVGSFSNHSGNIEFNTNKLAVKAKDNIYKTEFTNQDTHVEALGAFVFFSSTFKLSQEAVNAILSNDDIILIGYYPKGYFEYSIPISTLKEWRIVINKGPVTYPNPIKF